MDVSIIFPVKNEGIQLKNTLDSLFSKKTNTTFKIIIVNDGSNDGCCDFLNSYEKKESINLIVTEGIGAANARNLGASHADSDYLIFCDAHLQFEDWWIDRLLEPLHLQQTDAVSPAIGSFNNDDFIGFGQTLLPNLRIKWNAKPDGLSETAILPGACLAISQRIFAEVGGFDKGFPTWGHEDVEFSIKLWLFGYRCHVLPTVKILHFFKKQLPYEVRYEDFFYNLLRMAYSHFTIERIQKCKKLMLHTKAREIERKVVKNGGLDQRRNYFKRRVHTDDWYFHKFTIDF
ncbi:glycosyltransferase [Caldibacillus lycopersici]|uniref:Glycosyltransferase n=1 Tax=Perspicuibacillus lycopersici TaxID=1325689 RepID=A0AAE3LP30_9BACI|nr:glycosyltransferase [Perspicuibacillus lycopersici]MCU9614561.1 glycosyltransferase [Perspicuibacillus lycopersici]